MKKFLTVLFLLLLSCRAFAEEADVAKDGESLKDVELPMIIVTPTKYETSLDGIPTSFTVIYEDEILAKGKMQVKGLLMDVPGLHIVQSGSFGSATSIFTRARSQAIPLSW